MFQPMTRNLILKDFDRLYGDIISCEDDSISGEEASGIGLKLGDLFSRIVNDAKATLARPFSHGRMVRSEFTAFEKGHKLHLKALFKDVDISKSNTYVVVPENFISTYPDAVNDVQKGLDIIQFDDTLDRFANTIEDLRKEDVERYYLSIGRLNQDQTKITKISKRDAEDITKGIFDPRKWDKQKEKPAKDVFLSTKDMEKTQDVIREWEGYHKQAIVAQERLETLNEQVDSIIDTVLKMETVKKKTLSTIHGYLQAMAVQVDMYGAFIHHAQVIEHNYVVAAKTLLKEEL